MCPPPPSFGTLVVVGSFPLPRMQLLRFSSKALLIAVALAACLAAVIGGVIRSVNLALDDLEAYYALDQTRMMLTDFAEANHGDWPASWDDLEPYYANYQHLGWSEDFKAHRQLVQVDFTFDPTDYFQQPSSEIPPVLVDANTARSEVDQANRHLLSLLESLREAR